MTRATVSNYYQAIIAFLGLLATFLTGLQTNEAITHAVPSNWVYGIGFAGSLITALGVHLKKANTADEVADLVDEIQKVVEAYKAAEPAVEAAVKAPSVPAVQAAVDAVKDAATPVVVEATPVVQATVKDAGEFVDEVSKVIATYKATKK
jgi:hypothetical protein